jgi:glutathione S-transferase
MRYWINGINAEMISIFDRAKFRKVQSIEDFLVEIDVFLAKVDKTIEGKYLLKDGISLADLMIYPWFERWVIIEHYFGFSIPEKYLKIHKWLKNMNGRRSIL